MALESIEGAGKYISDLDENNPLNTDNPGTDGDNHLRGIKNTIKNTFPSVTGAVTATHGELSILSGVTASAAELNILDGLTATTGELNYSSGVTSAIQTQLDSLSASVGKSLTIVKQTTERVNNSSTLQDDDDFSFPVLANTAYKIHALIAYTSSATADLKMAFSVPSGASGYYAQTNESGTFSPVGITTSVVEAGAGSSVKFTRLYGYVVPSATPGDLVFQWAQNTAEFSYTDILAGSWMTVETS